MKNLSKHFIITGSNIKGKTIINAVKNIFFSIYEGDSLGLIGESGSVSLLGKEITGMDEGDMRKHRKDIQIVFQQAGNSLDPKMTIGEVAKEPLKIHRIVKERDYDKETDRLLGLVGISLKISTSILPK